MKRIGRAIALAAVLVLAVPAHAKLAKVGKSTVVFAAKGTGGMTIVGTTPELMIRDDGKTLRVTVPLANLTTGIALRDRHMREKYLHVGQYPVAELSVERAQLKPPASGSVSGDASGLMKIHGKSKKLTFHYSGKKNGSAIQVTATARLDLRDYGIEVPSFLGVTVKPEIDLTVTFDAKDS